MLINQPRFRYQSQTQARDYLQFHSCQKYCLQSRANQETDRQYTTFNFWQPNPACSSRNTFSSSHPRPKDKPLHQLISLPLSIRTSHNHQNASACLPPHDPPAGAEQILTQDSNAQLRGNRRTSLPALIVHRLSSRS